MRRDAWPSSESSGDNEQTSFNSVPAVWTRTAVEAAGPVGEATAGQMREGCGTRGQTRVSEGRVLRHLLREKNQEDSKVSSPSI